MMLLSMLVSKLLFNAYKSFTKYEEKEEIAFVITAKNGVIGCLSKEKFKEEEAYYNSGNYEAAQKLIDEQICFYFEKGYKMFAKEGTCSQQDKDDALFPFKPNDFMMLQPYLPCAAVR